MAYTIREINRSEDLVSTSLVVHGWVQTHRQSKRVSFIQLSDGTTTESLQLVIDPTLPSYLENLSDISTGAALTVTGKVVPSPAQGQAFELQVQEIRVEGKADPESYPLQKKGHTLEFLRDIVHLRGRSRTIAAVMRVRSAASFAVHDFFRSHGFYHLHSPVITTSDCEGAGEMFCVTALDIETLAKEGKKIEFARDFFGKKAFLTVSGQLEAEIYATALSRVYTFGPTFRAENSNTARHLAEFWMIEPEVAFCDLKGNMDLAGAFVVSVLKQVLSECQDDLAFLHGREWVEQGYLQNLEKVASTQPVAMTYTEAIGHLTTASVSFEFPVKWGLDLQAEHERYLCEEVAGGPLFVTDYPKEIKAFYMRLNDDEKTVAAMDLLVPRLGEIIGGSQREERYQMLEQRIIAAGLPVESYQWYLDLRRFGTVPHAGFGLGFERLLMYITGIQNIRDVIPFPRHPGHAAC
jgi:asparaginyl-tRNA synthetase